MTARRQGGSERGKRAGFDRRTGAATGSGSEAGDVHDGGEDYDTDLEAGGIAPPRSDPSMPKRR